MSDLIDVILYPLEQFVLLLFSMSFDYVTVGSLILSALLICVIFRLFIGQHVIGGVFEDVHMREDRERHRLRLQDERDSRAEAFKEMREKERRLARLGVYDGSRVGMTYNYMDEYWE